MDTFWLGRLAQESLGNFEATPQIDRDLSLRAWRARTDPAESWALFTILSWKIERFVRRFRRWRLDPWELDDVVQESYFVYLLTLRRWKPRYVHGRPAGYLYYFLAVFPRWLENVVRAWKRSKTSHVQLLPDLDAHAGGIGDSTAIDDICAALRPRDIELFRLRAVDDLSVQHAATTIGIPLATAYDRWRHITRIGREYLREAG